MSMCNDPDSGGRMIDNIITNTLLPALSREFLNTLACQGRAEGSEGESSQTAILRMLGCDAAYSATT